MGSSSSSMLTSQRTTPPVHEASPPRASGRSSRWTTNPRTHPTEAHSSDGPRPPRGPLDHRPGPADNRCWVDRPRDEPASRLVIPPTPQGQLEPKRRDARSDSVLKKGKPSDPASRRVEDRVRDGGRDRDDRRLDRSGGVEIRTIDQHHLDRRYVGEARHPVFRQPPVQDPSRPEVHRFKERPACSRDDSR